jgi:glutaminase
VAVSVQFLNKGTHTIGAGLYKMMLKKQQSEDNLSLKITAVMLSWGIYGASVDWKRSIKEKSPEEYIRLAIPYIMSGIDSKYKSK